MAVTDIATAHYKAQQAISRKTTEQAQRLWGNVRTNAVLDSWIAHLAEMVGILERGQLEAASLSQPYLDALAAAQELPTPPVGLVNPFQFVGVGADGRALTSLLMQPALRTLGMVTKGADDATALRSGLASLVRIVDTEISDTSRAADQTGMVARRAWVMYVRHVTLPACGRCIILAGRTYSWSTGFERHPQCDCTNVPMHEGDANPATPEELFAQMTPAEQARAFTVGGAEAIRLGADLGQVINARRGMQTSGGRLVTTEGTTVRGFAGRKLGNQQKQAGSRYRRSQSVRQMPEQLLMDANGDRDLAIRLLERHGYLDTSSVRRIAAAQASPAVPITQAPTVEQAAVAAELIVEQPAVDLLVSTMKDSLRHVTNADGIKWAREEWPMPDSITSAERDALREYTGNDYEMINNKLRGLEDPPEKHRARIDQIIADADSAFSKSSTPESVILFRDVGRDFLNVLGADFNDPEKMAALVGSVHIEPGYLSTCVGARSDLGAEVNLMFRVPQGYEAANVMPLSKNDSEREVVLRRNAKYVVHATYKVDEAWYLEVEVVPDDWTQPDNWTPDPYNDAEKGYQK